MTLVSRGGNGKAQGETVHVCVSVAPGLGGKTLGRALTFIHCQTESKAVNLRIYKEAIMVHDA